MPITETLNIYARGANRVVTFGFPLKEGFNLTSAANLRLKDAGNIVSANFVVKSRWKGIVSDTSKAIKWLAVTFRDGATPRTLTIEDTGGTVPATTNPLVVTTNTNDFVVSNGLLSLTINKQANAFDLLTSFQTGGTERLHASNKPRVLLPIDKKTQATWTNSAFDYAMLATESTVKVLDTSIFNVGDTVSFEWEATIESYLPTGGYQGRPFIVLQQPFSLQEITLATTPKTRLYINPGGSQQDVELYFSDAQGFTLTTAPGSAPVAGQKVRIKAVENEPDKIIQSINTGASTITFTAPVSAAIPYGVDVVPAGGGTINASMKLTGAVIEKQYGDLMIIIRQDGVMANPTGGAQINQNLYFQQRWYIFADTGFVRSRTTWRNQLLTLTTAECPDVNIKALKLDFPMALGSNVLSDSVTDMTTAVTRYKAGNLNHTLTHSAIASFKFAVPEFAVQFPKAHALGAAGYTHDILPSQSGGHRLKGSSIKTHDLMIGINADLGLPYVDTLGVVYDPVYMASSKAIRPNIVEKRNWSTVFAGESQRFRDACNRYERLVASGYDITAAENVSGSRIAQTLAEYRTEYPERSGDSNYFPFGWEKFGNTNEDIGFTNNRYDLPYIMFREGLRESDAAKAEKAFKLAFQQIRNRIEIGQYWSHKDFGGTGVDLFGLARYERAYAPDPFNSGRDPIPTHSWNEGSCLYWALTDDPIAEEAAKAGVAQARVYNYQGTYGARLFGTGTYQMKNPGSGTGPAEPRYIGWPILNLVAGYRYFGDPADLTRAIDYATCFVTTQASESANDGFIDFVADDGTIQPLFQHAGYVMHGIIEAWREASGSSQSALGTYIAKVANFLFKGDQQLANPGANSPLLANGTEHPNDNTKYNPATYFPFTYKRSFADALTAGITNSQTTIPVGDLSTFLLNNNGDYGNPAASAVGILIGNISDVTTWEYFKYTGRSATSGAGNLTGVTRGFGSSGAKAFSSGAIVYPLGLGGALNDIIVATLIAGARVTGVQQLQDFAEKIWADNCLYRDEYTTDNPAFVTKGTYSPINFWPKNIGTNAPKIYAQSATALSEFLGDRISPQPVPSITSISPSVVAVGSANTPITVNGTNFESGSTIRVNGAAITTTYVSATQLTAVVASSNFATPGTLNISVQNASSGNVSGSVPQQVANAPAISSLFPSSAASGGSSFILTVNGTNLDANCVVLWNGSVRTTNLVGSTLQAQISAGDIAAAGTAQVRVRNTVNTLETGNSPFTITAGAAAPSISSLSPNSATAGAAGFTITVNGANFVNGASVKWGGVAKTTSFVSSTQLTATILASDISVAGTVQVTVTNPDNQTSVAASFTVNAAPSAPAISSLSPASATAGAAQFTLTINGSNFASDAVAKWNGANLPTAFVSSTQITATVSASLITTAGSAAVTVQNVTSNQTSAASTFTINAAPVPAISSISPTSVTAGSGQFTLTVNGTNFASDAQVRIAGNPKATTFVSAQQLTAIIPASDIQAAGTLAVTVRNVSTNQVSASASLTVTPANNPVPSISAISPTSATAGAGQTTLTVTGANFVSDSIVRWNGTNLTTSYINSAQLTAVIPANLLSAAGSVNVTVFTPTPGGGTSNAVAFTINAQQAPAPVITTLSPNSTTAGGSQFSLTVNGQNFVNGATVRVNGSNRTTAFVGSTQLTAVIPGADIAAAATLSITVLNPDAQVSSAVTFNVLVVNAPTISSLSPATVTPGSAGFTLAVNGSNFTNQSQINIGGAARTTTYVSPTRIETSITANEVATAGTLSVTVTQPGVGTSTAATLPIQTLNAALPKLRPGFPGRKTTLRIQQGKTFQSSIAVKDGNSIVDLTGVTAVMQVRLRPADEEIGISPLLELNTTNGGLAIDSVNGFVTINITATQSATLKFARALFELEAMTPQGIVVSLIKGEMRITKEIVR